MDGISLSKQDRLLICLSIILPPLATYLKFGRSKTLTTNCLLTACLFVPGIIHAIKSIHCYPSVVFRGKSEPKDRTATARDESVIWEIPRDHFRSISDSIRVFEAQTLALSKNNNDSSSSSDGDGALRKKSAAYLSHGSGSKSKLTMVGTKGISRNEAASSSYLAYVDGSAPLLNPSYGWGTTTASKEAVVGIPPVPPVPWAIEAQAMITSTLQTKTAALVLAADDSSHPHLLESVIVR
ncbi:hypothetical protein GGI25_002089 [Coemansia spiralis]|uniref:Uncharacterized protein n=2 Tax=Coemansia TaxID=4863 RepID=A0A9W8G9A1_9FUNG|nr:hypothetical protein BX070DRAFT_232295 [Coemansia spiralis]KAJ1988879.1 hypothetical protein EDC05_005039 [Coemansia umbellata]KAJ2619945.1 hypothetical protein GGI26_005398 [Coemansia sp. RSA 1358]KAJ2678705.1 hypothetical protein GGI25_002089 [Coemansia spiralis]